MTREIHIYTTDPLSFRTVFLLRGDHGIIQFWFRTTVASTGVYGEHKAELMAVDLGYHSKTPHYEDQSQMKCDYLSEGKCYYDGSTLAAQDLLRRFLSEGVDIVWKTLEEIYNDRFVTNPPTPNSISSSS